MQRFFFLVVLTIVSSSASAGKLDAVRDATRELDKPSATKEKKHKRDRDRGNRLRGRRNSSDCNWLSLSLELFDSQPACPPTQHVHTTGPVYVESSPTYVESPPIQISPTTSIGDVFDDDLWFSRFTLFGGTDSETLEHGNLSWLLQVPGSVGLDTSLTMFRESDRTFRDHLWLGDVNLVFEPIVGPLRGRFGVGINWMHDNGGTESGGNLTAGFDWLMFDILNTSGEIDYGTLGQADYFHGQISAGIQLGFVELFVGYNSYDIGGAKIDGTMTGLRFKF